MPFFVNYIVKEVVTVTVIEAIGSRLKETDIQMKQKLSCVKRMIINNL